MRLSVRPDLRHLLVRGAVVGALMGVGWLFLMGPPPSVALSASELSSYDHLLSAESFAGPAVGIAGTEPDESKAVRLLAASRNGGTAFKYLLIRGTTAGKLYALAGLRHTNPSFFQIVVQPFRIWPGEVQTISGCVGRSVEIRGLVSTRGENPVRLEPGETLAQWWKRRKPGVEVDIDIVGGGYTSMFIDFAELTRPAA